MELDAELRDRRSARRTLAVQSGFRWTLVAATIVVCSWIFAGEDTNLRIAGEYTFLFVTSGAVVATGGTIFRQRNTNRSLEEENLRLKHELDATHRPTGELPRGS